jgi:ribose 5-phosphate isomerase A
MNRRARGWCVNLSSTMTICDRALEFIASGAIVGLGSGRAATSFVRALGERVRHGLHVRGVPTSSATADLAQQLGIPLTTPSEVEAIDVCVDGADEVDPNLDLIKGLGGALVREKIVAASARRVVILVGPEKLVSCLGNRGVLPVEIVPFALSLCRRRLEALGIRSKLRLAPGSLNPFITDNGNHILDCQVGPINQPAELEGRILGIPGVVDSGLFLGIAHTILIQRNNDVEEWHRPTVSA